MTNQKYNGWTNRETWVINLWLGEDLRQTVTEYLEENENADKVEIANIIENLFDEMYDGELNQLSGVLRDLLYTSSINWVELAENYMED
jgi:hypothetical protein